MNRDEIRESVGGQVQDQNDDDSGSVIERAEASCLKPGVSCLQVHCPSFALLNMKQVANVELSLTLDPTQYAIQLEGDKEKMPDFITVLVEGHAALPKALEGHVDESLNVRPDHLMLGTKFIYASSTFQGIPLWQIIVAVVGSLLLLGVIILILVKCGFFRRKRPPTGDETDGAEATTEELQKLNQPLEMD